jgi:DNA-binding response OmpR family regulator
MSTNSRHLLIVDEEPTLLDSLTDLLIAEGYLVMPAANRREVLACADKLPVDLALLD